MKSAGFSRRRPMRGSGCGRTLRLPEHLIRGPFGRSSEGAGMKRSDLEHILRASAAITGADQLVVIGSQALLGQFPDAPKSLTKSFEVDIFTFRDAQDAALIDGSIGELSPFHTTFGYFAHGVAEETATLPNGWKSRLIEVRSPMTAGATGLCLEVHDLAISKLVAGREKDIEFISELLEHALVTEPVLVDRLAATVLDDSRRESCRWRLKRIVDGLGSAR